MKEKKCRILYLLKILNENTDSEERAMTTNELIEALKEKGIHAHRKTIASDVKLLQDFGIDVNVKKSTQNKHYIGDRAFELPELKLLVDAVEASKFITKKKSEILVKKLTDFTCKCNALELKRDLYIEKRIKQENERIYYIVDDIYKAINTNKQIKFNLLDYCPDKTKCKKHDGYVYTVSPYALCWNDENYYLFGCCDKYDKVVKFRVDRMENVIVTNEDSKESPENFDKAVYLNEVFLMYDGEHRKVELKCVNDLMRSIIDRFGEEVNTEMIDDNYFKAAVDVSVSPTFFGWVFQFAGGISILSPQDVRDTYVAMAKDVIAQ